MKSSPLISAARARESSFLPSPSPPDVDVGGVEADGAGDFGVHRGAEGEMAAHADAHRADLAGAVRTREDVGDCGAGVGVVGGEGLVGLEEVATVGAGLVVGEGYAGLLVLVVDLGHGDDVAVAGEQRGGAADRAVT
jgi:hypothetical protein